MNNLFLTIHMVLIFTGSFILSAETQATKTKIFSEPSPIISHTVSQPSQNIPVIFYNHEYQEINLKYISDNKLINTNLSPTHISSYHLSPQKKYLILQTTTPTQVKASFIDNLINQLLEKLLKRKISEGTATANNVTKIIDLRTQSEVASFSGNFISHEFSPNEQTILIAQEYLGADRSSKGALPLGTRTSADTTRYGLFDFTTRTVLTTFENVKTIGYIGSKTVTKSFESYTAENNILVQYDDNTVEQITLERVTPKISLLQKIIDLFKKIIALFTLSPSSIQVTTTPRTTDNIPSTITYYGDSKRLDITTLGKEFTYANIVSYTLSPHKNYLCIIQTPNNTMSLLNMNTGQQFNRIATKVITYEFNPNTETCLISLGAPREYFTDQKILYSLLNLEKFAISSASLNKFTTDNTLYYESTNELVVIKKNSPFMFYDPKTGITFTQEQIEEFNKKKQLKKDLPHFDQLIQKAIDLNFTDEDIQLFEDLANNAAQKNITLEQIDDINDTFSKLKNVIKSKEKDKRLEDAINSKLKAEQAAKQQEL